MNMSESGSLWNSAGDGCSLKAARRRIWLFLNCIPKSCDREEQASKLSTRGLSRLPTDRPESTPPLRVHDFFTAFGHYAGLEAAAPSFRFISHFISPSSRASARAEIIAGSLVASPRSPIPRRPSNAYSHVHRHLPPCSRDHLLCICCTLALVAFPGAKRRIVLGSNECRQSFACRGFEI